MKNKQTKIAIITALLFVAIFVLSKKAKAKSMTGNLSFIKNQDALNKFNSVHNALKNAGFTGDTLRFALAQMLHETGAFTSKSKVFTDNNNASGIMFINKPSLQKNAVKGTPFPANEGKYFYAKFATLTDWAKDFRRILSLGVNKPANATTLSEYVSRLKANKYFTDSEKNYLAGTTRYYNLIA